MFFEVTYTDGTVEEVEADECQDNAARYLTFVRYRIPLCGRFTRKSCDG
jgi:hypothetical protein